MTTPSALKPGTWNVDAAHSEVGFTARHLMVSKVRGQFKDFAAVVTVAQPFNLSSVEATIQLASVDTNSTDRDTHLKSADFFDVENNPTLTFKSTKVTDSTLEGLLTIKGITKPVTLTVISFMCMPHPMVKKDACGATATAKVKRSDFNMGKYAPLVGDEVTLTIPVESIKQ